MHMQIKTMLLMAALSAAPSALHAQFDFNLAGCPVQVHSFASQGFAYSNGWRSWAWTAHRAAFQAGVRAGVPRGALIPAGMPSRFPHPIPLCLARSYSLRTVSSIVPV